MADNSKGQLGALLGQIRDLWPVLAGAVTVAGFLYHLEGSTGQAARDILTERLDRAAAIAEVKMDVEAKARRQEEHDKAQDDHMARIDDARSINLQRVATLEQGQKMTQDMLTDIRDKIDRMLMSGFAPVGGKR